MEKVVFFSTSPFVRSKFENQPLTGVILRQLKPQYAENTSYDFSSLSFAANVDLKKISMRSVIDYLMPECTAGKGKHYIELDGRRYPVHKASSIYAEADKIDQRYMLYSNPGDGIRGEKT